MDFVTLGPWDPGTLGPWDPGTLGPWDPGTLGPWDPWTLGPWDPGTLVTVASKIPPSVCFSRIGSPWFHFV